MPHLHPSRRSAPLENKIYFPNASSEQLIHFNSVTVCVDTQRIKLLSFPADSKPFVSPAFRGILLLEAGVLLRGHGGGGALGFGLLVVLVSPCVAVGASTVPVCSFSRIHTRFAPTQRLCCCATRSGHKARVSQTETVLWHHPDSGPSSGACCGQLQPCRRVLLARAPCFSWAHCNGAWWCPDGNHSSGSSGPVPSWAEGCCCSTVQFWKVVRPQQKSHNTLPIVYPYLYTYIHIYVHI